MDAATVYENIRALSAEFATERRERQQRNELVAADFARLREAGFLSSDRRAAGPWRHLGKRRRGHPADLRDAPHAHGDSSVALVCAMHPVVLSFWMAIPRAPAPFDNAWEGQRRSIFRNVCEGAWWGTIASEPGTSGDIAKTRATARRGPTDGAYLLTGQKNFGSGSGHLLHGHRGRSRRGDRPGHVRAGYAGRALGRLGRGDPDGCMGGARYARNSEPRDGLQRVSCHMHGMAGAVPAHRGSPGWVHPESISRRFMWEWWRSISKPRASSCRDAGTACGPTSGWSGRRRSSKAG